MKAPDRIFKFNPIFWTFCIAFVSCCPLSVGLYFILQLVNFYR